jgi:hypothetical protein
VAQTRARDYRFGAIVLGVVSSPAFQMRMKETAGVRPSSQTGGQ